MVARTRLFIDYWNFQLNWNERANDARCDWLALPAVLMRASENGLRLNSLAYEGTHIYASVDPNNENLISWLGSFLERQPGFVVKRARQVRRPRSVRCSACGTEIEECPECSEPFSVGASKGLTTRMVVDLMALAGNGGCEVPIVISSDAELVPVMRFLRDRGIKLIHAGWRNGGPDLAREAWASIELDSLMGDLVRS